MRFDTKITNCPNCGQQIKEKAFTFQAVRICGDCARILQRALAKAEEELNCIRSMYSEVLRVALLKGELRLPPYPVPKDVGKPEILAEMRRLVEQFGAGHARRDHHAPEGAAQGEGEVHPLRDGPQDRGPVSVGDGADALPGRR